MPSGQIIEHSKQDSSIGAQVRLQRSYTERRQLSCHDLRNATPSLDSMHPLSTALLPDSVDAYVVAVILTDAT